MNKNIKISDIEKNKILNLYKNGHSMRKIENLFPYSFTFIQKLIKTHDLNERLNITYSYKNDEYIVAICKKTNKVINDYKNESGAITNHIKREFPKKVIESNYKRKSIEWETGKYWYHNYFDFIIRNKSDIKKCYYCDWRTVDVNNQSGAYEKHLESIHNIDILTHIKEVSEDIKYFKYIKYENPVICKICSMELKMINDKHLKKHNITLYEYKLKYGINGIVSDKTHKKLSKLAIENNINMSPKKTSKPENEIVNYLKSKNLNILQSTRKLCDGQEIDIVISNTPYCIEFNGCKYHTEIYGGKDKNYHLNKTKKLVSKGKLLIHIFEDEWFNTKKIVKSKLDHIIGISSNQKIYARKCSIREIDSSTKNNFLNEHHIQGGDLSNIKFGLYYNNELLAVMTFNNKRAFNKTNDHNNMIYELTRYATHQNYHVVGGASKIIKKFIREYNVKSIISFADRRWTLNENNNLYTKLGFKLVKVLSPDYTYYNSSIVRYKRFHKFGFGKSSLKKKYPEIYNDNKTEWEMMQEMGWDRIWDCGKFKYEMLIAK